MKYKTIQEIERLNFIDRNINKYKPEMLKRFLMGSGLILASQIIPDFKIMTLIGFLMIRGYPVNLDTNERLRKLKRKFR